MRSRFLVWLAAICLLALAAACSGLPGSGVPGGSPPVAGGQGQGPGQDVEQSRYGGISIRMVLAERAVVANRAVQALAGIVGKVKLQLSGRNVPPATPPFVINRSEFKDDQANVTIGNLLPGPIRLDVTLLDAGDLVLGTAMGEATVSAGTTAPMVLAINPDTGSASVTIDPAALGEPRTTPVSTPSLKMVMRGVTPGTWAPGPPLAIARAGLGAGSLGGKLFAVSGDSHLSLETYDAAAGAWSPTLLPASPQLIMVLAGAATVRDQIVLLGGDAETSGGLFERLGPVYVSPGAGPGGLARVVAPTTGVPAEADEAFWRTAAGVAAIGDLAFLVGGVSQRLDTNAAPGGNGYVHPPATEVLDVGRGVWLQRSPIPTPRAGLVVGAVKGKLVAAGGYRWTGGPGNAVDVFQKLPYTDAALGTALVLPTVEVYDPVADTWSAGPALATGRHSAAVAVAGDRVYVLGGADAAGKVLAGVESWALGEPAWRAEPPMPTARALCAAGVGADGLIAVMGGLDETGTALRTVEFFNPGVLP